MAHGGKGGVSLSTVVPGRCYKHNDIYVELAWSNNGGHPLTCQFNYTAQTQQGVITN